MYYETVILPNVPFLDLSTTGVAKQCNYADDRELGTFGCLDDRVDCDCNVLRICGAYFALDTRY
jgi:hypothetical protein